MRDVLDVPTRAHARGRSGRGLEAVGAAASVPVSFIALQLPGIS
jgi:hypothetical protein